MKISLKWLKDYVEIPDSLELSRLSYDLTMSTVEVEGTHDLASKFDNMVVGKIIQVLPHPDADKLRICKTDIGDGVIKDIVCGGSNLSENMLVALALPGAIVRWHGEGEPVEIKCAKLRGVESYGMICASTEIGLSDLFPLHDEHEVVDLSDFDITPGTPLATALNLDDIILEIDNKSLTNRPDLWGHYGIAREISAIYNLPFKTIESYTPTCKTEYNVTIENPDVCPRYIGVKIEGVNPEPSTYEIQRRIWSVGVRPINSLVDITNYVMLTTGNPTHAFDSDHIKGGINVRLAKKDEKLTLLDGKELKLNSTNLVIADEKDAVALAGVMGGLKDSILEDTTKVILEVANFDPLYVRHTATNYDVRTEASIRYEKGIDPDRCDIALSLAMQMFNDNYPDMKVIEYKDNYPNKPKPINVEVSLDWLEDRLGKRIPNKEIEDILNKLGFESKINGDIITVSVPSWRATGDISLPEDILEEIARLHGFENFEAVPISTTFENAINQIDLSIDRKIREYLAFRCGMQEIFTYPWVNIKYLQAIHSSTDKMLSLSTPPSPDEKYIRTSHIPNLCKAVSENLRYAQTFSIFECAQVFYDSDYKELYDSRELLPKQRKSLAGALVGPTKNLDTLFRNAKGILENLSRYNHLEEITLKQVEKPTWADDTVWLNILSGNECIGCLALLSKKASITCGIKNSTVIIFELDVDSLKALPSRTNQFSELPEYQMMDYDLSLLIDESIKWEDLVNTIGSNAILQDINFVGIYHGEQVPTGKKSLTLRLVIGSLEKTLTSIEVEKYVDSLVKKLNTSLGAELR